MKSKPECFHNNIKNRKVVKNSQKNIAMSSNIKTIANNNISPRQIPIIKQNQKFKTSNCPTKSSRTINLSNVSTDLDCVNSQKDIPEILAKFAEQNQQLARERHALFQKNCQLVNRIKQYQKQESISKIKSLKSLQILKQQYLVRSYGKVPHIFAKNTNLINNEKKQDKNWLIENMNQQINDKILLKKSREYGLKNYHDLNMTRKQFCTKKMKFDQSFRQYFVVDNNDDIKDQFKMKQGTQQNVKRKSFYKQRNKLLSSQVQQIVSRKNSKSQYISLQKCSNQQTPKQLIEKPLKNTSEHTIKKSPVKFYIPNTNYCENNEKELDQISRKTQKRYTYHKNHQQRSQNIRDFHQNGFKKQSPQYFSPTKACSKRQMKVTIGIEEKLLRIRKQNNQLRKQLVDLN